MATRNAKKGKKGKSQGPRPARSAPLDRLIIDARLGSDDRFWATVIGKIGPKPADAEPLYDVAVFDDDVLAGLDENTRNEVQAVRESLHWVENGQDELARDRVSGISRRSDLSEWRLLVRLLSDWYRDDFDAARATFEKLNAERRPWRIAHNLLEARDQHTASQAPPNKYLSIAPGAIPRAALVESVRRTSFDRPAIAEIQRLLNEADKLDGRPDDDVDIESVGPRTCAMILAFCRRYRAVETSLVEAIESNLRRRVYHDEYEDVYTSFSSQNRGPAYDPNLNLFRYLYLSRFEDAGEDAAQMLCVYDHELQTNQRLSEPFRHALRSLLHTRLAEQMLGDLVKLQKMHQVRFLASKFRTEERLCLLSDVLSHALERAIGTYPANRTAHEIKRVFIRMKLEEAENAEQRRQLKELECAANEEYVAQFPGAIEIREELLTYYLANNLPEKAEAHVKFLNESRIKSFSLQMFPWKRALNAAMEAARRKTQLNECAVHLDTAASNWPEWISDDWIPYLQAALQMRVGDPDGYTFAVSSNSLKHAVAMLAAAQNMHVSAKEISELRERVHALVKGKQSLPYNELVATAAFLHHLWRAEITYAAYRNHAGDIQKRLIDGTKSEEPASLAKLGIAFEDAMLWLAEKGSARGKAFDVRMQAMLRRSGKSWLLGVGSVLEAAADNSRIFSPQFERELESLEEYIPSEQDSFRKHLLQGILDRGKKMLDEQQEMPFGGRGASFMEAMEAVSDVMERIEGSSGKQLDVDDFNFDPDCDCPNCVAKRISLSDAMTGFSIGDDDDDDDYDDEEDDDEDYESPDMFFVPDFKSPNRSKPDPNVGAEIKKTRPKQPLNQKKKKKG